MSQRELQTRPAEDTYMYAMFQPTCSYTEAIEYKVVKMKGTVHLKLPRVQRGLRGSYWKGVDGICLMSEREPENVSVRQSSTNAMQLNSL